MVRFEIEITAVILQVLGKKLLGDNIRSRSRSEESLGISRLHDEPQDPVIIPLAALAPDVLRGIVESFVLREGTDYGAQEFSLEQKVAHVMRQLQRHEVQIMFDPTSNTVDLITGAARVQPAR